MVAMRYERASVMSETMVLNYSVGSTGVLIESGIGVLMGTATSMVGGSLTKVLEIVDLTSKELERLVGSTLSAVGAGTRVASGVCVVFFLNVMED